MPQYVMMSFAFTANQLQDRTKDVTYRLGWEWLKPGQLIQPVVRTPEEGLKAGERIRPIGGLIQVTKVSRLKLSELQGDLGVTEAAREGYPMLDGPGFAEMFCRHHNVKLDTVVTRIEFVYTNRKL